jgi:uncharacterized protein (TIRG00374 family)
MKRWQFWLGVIISAACMVFVVLQIEDFAKFGRSFLEARYLCLIPLIATYFLIMFLRSIRWKYILDQGGTASLRNAWVSMLVCYMGNNIFPLRAGEFMRVFLIGKQEQSITYSAALATVVVERLFDFIVMLITLAVVLMIVEFPPEHQELEALMRGFGGATLVGAAGLFVFLFLLYLKSEAMISLIERALFFIPEKLRGAILDIAGKFAQGLVIMGQPRALFILLGMSLIVWLVNLPPLWLAGFAFNINLSFTHCMFMLVVGAAAASIPATPGFFGTFHAFNQQAMVLLLAIDPETALSFAIVLHATYYFPMIIAGAIAAWREGYSLTRLREEAEESGHEV